MKGKDDLSLDDANGDKISRFAKYTQCNPNLGAHTMLSMKEFEQKLWNAGTPTCDWLRLYEDEQGHIHVSGSGGMGTVAFIKLSPENYLLPFVEKLKKQGKLTRKEFGLEYWAGLKNLGELAYVK